MTTRQTNRYSSTGVYLLFVFILIAAIVAIFYLVEDPVKKYGFALIPFLLLFTTKNSVIELQEESFIIKNYLLFIKRFETAYTYKEVAFVHYHRAHNGFFSSFDFWGIHNRKSLEVRFADLSSDILNIYGVTSKINSAIQDVNYRVVPDEESLVTDRSELISK